MAEEVAFQFPIERLLHLLSDLTLCSADVLLVD